MYLQNPSPSTTNRNFNIGGNLDATNTSSLDADDNLNRQQVLVAGNFSVTSGTFTLGKVRLRVSGTTTIDATIGFSSTRGVKTFIGAVTVNASGTWDNSQATEDFFFRDDLTVNGTWNGCPASGVCQLQFQNTPVGGSIISGSTTIDTTDITVDSGDEVVNNGTVLLDGDITGSGTFTNGTTGTLTLTENGTYSVSTLDLDNSGNTVIYDGSLDEVIDIGPFHHLQVNMDASTNTCDINGTSVTVNGDLTITQGIVNLASANTLGVGGNVNIAADGELRMNQASAVLNVTGNVTVTSGEYDHDLGDTNITGDISLSGSGALFTIDGGASTTIDANDLTVSGGALTLTDGTLTLSGNYNLSGGTNDINEGTLNFAGMTVSSGATITVESPSITSTGTITLDNGTFTIDGSLGSYSFGSLDVNTNGNWNVTTSIDPSFSGDLSNDGTFTWCSNNNCDYTFSSTSGSISGGNQIILSDLVFSGSASYTNTNTAGLDVTQRVSGSSATFINGTNGYLIYRGNNVNTAANFELATFTTSATGNTVEIGGTTNQALPTSSGDYHNVIVNNTGSSTSVRLGGDITIANQLTLTSNNLTLITNNLTMGEAATITGGSSSSYIRISNTGVLRQSFSSTGASLNFPIGDNDYSPITAFTINSGTFAAGAYVEMTLTDALHPNRNTSNTPNGDDTGTNVSVQISRYWELSASGITNVDYDVSYQYIDDDVTQPSQEADMVGAIYRFSTVFGVNDWGHVGTVNASTNTVSFTGLDAFGDLYAMDNNLNRLPVELLYFRAEPGQGLVKLQWATTLEENNDFFTIERSGNLEAGFEPIGYMAGAGDSEDQLNYEFVDTRPLAGRSFYRLKQTDFNGTFEYSELVTAFLNQSAVGNGLNASPNPVNRGGVLRISEGALQSLHLLNAQGRVVAIWKSQPGVNLSEVRIATHWQPGAYLLMGLTTSGPVYQRLLIQ